MSPDHPNARFLRNLYEGVARINGDASLDESARQARIADVVGELQARTSPDCLIHTGGAQLAAVGDMSFAATMRARRAALSANSFGSVGTLDITADDSYGIVRGTFRVVRDGQEVLWDGLGVWRFDDGVAVEHWEIGPSIEWDRYFLAADPEFTEGTATEFWQRSTPSAAAS